MKKDDRNYEIKCSRYVRNSLGEDEHVVVKAKKSWWYITWPTLLLAIAVAAMVLLVPILKGLQENIQPTGITPIDNMIPVLFNWVLPIAAGLILALPIFVVFWKHLLTILTLQVVLTDKRLISRVGLFRIRALDIPADKLDHIEIRAGWLGNLLHSYDVEIASVSGADGVIKRSKKSVRTFCGISNAKELRKKMQVVVDEHAQTARRLQAQEIAGAIRPGF